MTARADTRNIDLGEAAPALTEATYAFLTLWEAEDAAYKQWRNDQTTTLDGVWAEATKRRVEAQNKLRDVIPDDYGLWTVGPHKVGRLKVSAYGISRIIRPYGRRGPKLD